MGVSVDEYLTQLQALLPIGPAWTREADAALSMQLLAWADEFARLDARDDELIEEADPRTCTELLTDWEQTTGLTASGTVAERRAAVEAKLNAQGGISRPYFAELATAMGIVIDFTRYYPFQVGRSTVGEALTNGDWIYTWQVDGPLAGTTAESRADLEALFKAEAPAHTIVIFNWS